MSLPSLHKGSVKNFLPPIRLHMNWEGKGVYHADEMVTV
jgi:hypothetical protein